MAKESEATHQETWALYQIYIDYIRHENELLNHRTTWFLAIETVLIAAAGYMVLQYFESLVSHIRGAPDTSPAHVVEFLIGWSILCAFGLVTASAARCSIDAALRAQDTLTDHWEGLCRSLDGADQLPDLMGGKDSQARKDGGHFANRLGGAVLFFWTLCAVAFAVCIVLLAT